MLIRTLLNAFFPPVCPVCSSRTGDNAGLCPNCFARLEFVLDNPADRASALVYNDVSKRLVLALKYGDRLDLAPLLGRMMFNAGRSVLSNADLLTGVPLHWKRMLSRKYNQAVVLAEELSALSGVPVNPELLKREKSTPRQGTRKERFENVKGAFSINPAFSVQGKKIVLIDDVLTTGATVQACATVLLKNGAREVGVLTFAKAQNENQTRP